MTTGEGGPRVQRTSGREAGVSARLREAIFAAHEEAVRAVASASDSGLPVNRDLIELIELQRRVIRIADQFADEPGWPPRSARDGAAAAMGAISLAIPIATGPAADVHAIADPMASPLPWPAVDGAADSRLHVIEDPDS
ncbi:hypothetical protein ACFVUS_37250 [Nocardia sp. NPDC058058]|uniref:hypothetical protein n=1 Tax=Nocardia sp. NPDC058058 TaxID=3346317 RepID=UPI0036DD2895